MANILVRIESDSIVELTYSYNGLQLANGAPAPIIEQHSPHHFSAQKGDELYEIFIRQADHENQQYRLWINGKAVDARLIPLAQQYLQRIGIDPAARKKVAELRAPMPGLIRQTLVEAGQSVVKGQSLFILEAMKMENVIKAPADVTVRSIAVEPGMTVEKNALLMQFA